MDSVKNICKKGYTFGASDSSECFIESLHLQNTDQLWEDKADLLWCYSHYRPLDGGLPHVSTAEWSSRRQKSHCDPAWWPYQSEFNNPRVQKDTDVFKLGNYCFRRWLKCHDAHYCQFVTASLHAQKGSVNNLDRRIQQRTPHASS